MPRRAKAQYHTRLKSYTTPPSSTPSPASQHDPPPVKQVTEKLWELRMESRPRTRATPPHVPVTAGASTPLSVELDTHAPAHAYTVSLPQTLSRLAEASAARGLRRKVAGPVPRGWAPLLRGERGVGGASSSSARGADSRDGNMPGLGERRRRRAEFVRRSGREAEEGRDGDAVAVPSLLNLTLRLIASDLAEPRSSCLWDVVPYIPAHLKGRLLAQASVYAPLGDAAVRQVLRRPVDADLDVEELEAGAAAADEWDEVGEECDLSWSGAAWGTAKALLSPRTASSPSISTSHASQFGASAESWDSDLTPSTPSTTLQHLLLPPSPLPAVPLLSLLSTHPSLRSLSLAHSPTPLYLPKLARLLPRLEYLDLSACAWVTPDALLGVEWEVRWRGLRAVGLRELGWDEEEKERTRVRDVLRSRGRAGVELLWDWDDDGDGGGG